MRALDGNTFDAALALSPLHFGENLQVSLFVRDVTERRRAQQLEVQQREGLEREVAERTRELTREIAERKRVESKLRQATKAFENTRDAIVITDNESRITAVNAAFTEISGYSEDEVLGKLPWFFESGEDAGSPTAEVVRAVQGGGSWQGELPARRRDGTDYPAWLSVSSVRNPYGRLTNFVAVYSDITEIKRSQARLSFMVHHDALTGLPNRVMFSSLLSNAIVRARRAGGRFAVLFLDLDRFKNVNDSLGHDAGDALLKVVAARFRSALRESDALARVGGDEFTVLLESAANREEAGLVAHKLINVVREPMELDPADLPTFEVPIAAFSLHTPTALN